MESLQKDWDLSVSVTAGDNGPVYFCSENLPLRESQIRLSEDQDNLGRLVCLSTWKLSFGITASNPADAPHSNIMYNSFANDQLERELTEKCQQFGSKVELIPSFAYFPDDEANSVEKGFFVRVSAESAESVKALIAEMARKFGQAGYFEYEVVGGKIYQKLFTTIADTDRLVCSSPLVQIEPPAECHPLFTHSSLCPVFQDKAKVDRVLSEVSSSFLAILYTHI